MTNYGKLFADEVIEWLLEAGFIQYQCQMPIYYKYCIFDLNEMFEPLHTFTTKTTMLI